MLLREPVHQVMGERGNVGPPLAKRRHGDRKDAEAVVQVAPEPPGLDLLAEVPVGGRDDPDVDANRPRRAEALELAVLQHAEQLRLRFRRQLADFVEEDRPAVGELEAPHLRRARVGERALLAAEQLAFDQRRRQRRAVDADETGIAAGTLAVDRVSRHALPRAGFAEQQHRRVRRRHLLQAEPHVAEGITPADEIDRSAARRRRRLRKSDTRCKRFESHIAPRHFERCKGQVHAHEMWTDAKGYSPPSAHQWDVGLI